MSNQIHSQTVRIRCYCCCDVEKRPSASGKSWIFFRSLSLSRQTVMTVENITVQLQYRLHTLNTMQWLQVDFVDDLSSSIKCVCDSSSWIGNSLFLNLDDQIKMSFPCSRLSILIFFRILNVYCSFFSNTKAYQMRCLNASQQAFSGMCCSRFLFIRFLVWFEYIANLNKCYCFLNWFWFFSISLVTHHFIHHLQMCWNERLLFFGWSFTPIYTTTAKLIYTKKKSTPNWIYKIQGKHLNIPIWYNSRPKNFLFNIYILL